MLTKAATKLANLLLIRGRLSKENLNVYVYGFELLISFVMSTTVIICAGLVINRMLQTLVFLLVFILLRSFTGGFHANTYWLCSVVTFATYGCVMLLSEYVPVSLMAFIVLGIVGLILLIIIAPVKHPNKELTSQKYVRSKVVSVCLWLLFIILGASLLVIHSAISGAIFYSLIADLLLLNIKSSKERRNKDEVL